jgi:hypothetical protein
VQDLPPAIDQWTTEDVGAWLAASGFSAYRSHFAAAKIDGPALVKLDQTRLAGMGVSSPAQQNILSRHRGLLRKWNFVDPLQTPRPRPAQEEPDPSAAGLRQTPFGRTPSNLTPLSMFHFHRWPAAEVQNWLIRSNLEEYCVSFDRASIDGPAIGRMSDDELVALGAEGPHASPASERTLRAALTALRESGAVNRPQPASPSPPPVAPVAEWTKTRKGSSLAVGSGPPPYNDTASPSVRPGPAAPASASSTPPAAAPAEAAMGPRTDAESVAGRKHIRGWTISDVQDWLTEAGFGAHKEEFASRRIHGPTLVQLPASHLESLGMEPTEAQRMASFVKTLAGLPLDPPAAQRGAQHAASQHHEAAKAQPAATAAASAASTTTTTTTTATGGTSLANRTGQFLLSLLAIVLASRCRFPSS